MSADVVLSRLDGVRPTGTGRWIARCAAHDDRTPSLSIRELEDGRTLLYCFGGCSTIDVLQAMGLEFDALYPDKLPERGKPTVPRIPARDVLFGLRDEAVLVMTIAGNLEQGMPLTDEIRKRLFVAAARIDAACRYGDGRS